jgi:predicted ATPase
MVTGAKGVGKTHFSLTVSAEAAYAFASGVRFVSLSTLPDAGLVLPAIARELGLQGDPAEVVGEQQLLLVLDGLDDRGEAAGELAELIAVCPGLQLLVTTREPLPIAGEREYRLRPLPEAPAVELFRQRADAALPGLQVDYALAAAICRRIGNLPLAIETAAARVATFEPAAMLDRLERLLPALTHETLDEAVRLALPAVDSL